MPNVSPIAAIVSVLLSTSTLAQTIEGVVLNQKGEGIAGAHIEVEGTSSKIKTDRRGKFVITDLQAGNTELHFSAQGFAHQHRDLTLGANERKHVNITLLRSPIEVVDVVATPIHMSVMESAAPVSVISGDSLRRQQAATLGDSLEKIAGVNTNFHANVASTPIIRGLSGPRVMIAQNGLDTSDVSRVGPDHAVATEASTARQIEVLRGPATLFYGSGAVGGVVNVVDERVPTDNTTRGEWSLGTTPVNSRNQASFNITTGISDIALYADGHWRETGDYKVPVSPEAEHNEQNDNHQFIVKNSAEEAKGVTLGSSYLLENGYVGASIELFNRQYGIPGHSHGNEGIPVFADLEQSRIQVQGEFELDNTWISKVNLRGGMTHYEHAELENNEVGTLFENDTHELKVDLLHSPFLHWNGGVSVHLKHSEIAAQGEEAFTPPSEAKTLALALMEEKHFDKVLVQVGARIERVSLTADNVLLPDIDAHDHNESTSQNHDQHGHSDENTITRVFSVDQTFTPVTFSAGLVWDYLPGYNLGLSISRSERAPTASELLSFGPHIGTGSYEVGAMFAIHNDEEHAHFGLTDSVINLETANNIDLTFRKTQGDFGFVLNAFYNRIDNYYYQSATGLFAESGHDHSHAHSAELSAEPSAEPSSDHDSHSDELPIYLFHTDDVILHGFEAQFGWQVTDTIKATLFSDFVRARRQDGGNLPRTPPLRFGSQFSYEDTQLSAHIDVTRYQNQSRTAAEESTTDGYTLVDAVIAYQLAISDQDISIYLKGENLTDTEARVHSSFLKDIAPRPGRRLSLGIRGYF
ncbi:TonB-dependent receptor [Aestuariibacter sp. AA17]|uniref:TonB-dependent receptor n=1 Tax=Fluctibacter corallii TaxID=2984329 RepID=A0ABT3A674_9ALTE|nr:TonB-dependent receptor [Aestuariibacter sp. AA17]MCV2884172.1 TonB-dependent receptor [Aestuariibacter sp. AA17]